MTADLVKRLRDRRSSDWMQQRHEAADAIERHDLRIAALEAELARWKELCREESIKFVDVLTELVRLKAPVSDEDLLHVAMSAYWGDDYQDGRLLGCAVGVQVGAENYMKAVLAAVASKIEGRGAAEKDQEVRDILKAVTALCDVDTISKITGYAIEQRKARALSKGGA
jgi:hypothetical protein